MSIESKPVSAADKPKGVNQVAEQGQRLPCRGCKASCQNYATCEGKPWRVFK